MKRLLPLCVFLGFAFLFGQTESTQEEAEPQDISPIAAVQFSGSGITDLETQTLFNRFRNHTNSLFLKHGMSPVGYWTIIEGDNKENTLFYIIAHSDRSAAKESWSTFIADPEWKKVYKESRKNGPLVSKIKSEFMQITDYSPIK
ncbi:MAG TPA: NIPSNAP family protein [Candidatus Marinimicrobia bacterium]|nr:NIPSNAP family protein [Candidatus Neomarinimicrobiota bacterium]